jgi:ABC-type multidrug transport system fused ATPase/permease subunit
MVMFRVFVGAFALVFVAGNALAFLAGVWLMGRGEMTLGAIFTMMYYTSLMAWTLGRLADQMNDFQQATAAISRVDELIHTQSALVDGPHPLRRAGRPPVPPSLTFEHVTFSYIPGLPVLQDLSFHLEPGEVLGLVGRTGSGKSSVARLLFRFHDPERGTVRLDGSDIRTVQLGDLRSAIGFVTQDVQLFHASVRDNLTFFDDETPDARLLQVVEEVGLGSWLRRATSGTAAGLDTLLDGGRGLSAGEAQLLACARVFLKAPALVVLDEATARLDPATERLVEQAVDRLLHNRTAVVIAHRLHTVRRAHKILVLDEGRVLEYGRTAELAADPASHFAALLRSGTLEGEAHAETRATSGTG